MRSLAWVWVLAGLVVVQGDAFSQAPIERKPPPPPVGTQAPQGADDVQDAPAGKAPQSGFPTIKVETRLVNVALNVVDAKGARFASVAFVTGALDRAASRAEFLDLAGRAGVPILLVYGGETPPRSLAEIEALARLPGVLNSPLAHGKLAVHEEFADDVAAALGPFLDL